MKIGDTLLLKLNLNEGKEIFQYYIISEEEKVYTLGIANFKNEYIGKLSSFVEKPIARILLIETYVKF